MILSLQEQMEENGYIEGDIYWIVYPEDWDSYFSDMSFLLGAKCDAVIEAATGRVSSATRPAYLAFNDGYATEEMIQRAIRWKKP